jgi:predicted nuclease of predicted toxin-antitoxin system
MRFLVNENVTATVIRGLRDRGHDVLSVKESMRSEKDEAVLARAQADQRVVVTHDKDFGELAFRSKLPASCGVVLFRCIRSKSGIGQPSGAGGAREPERLGRPFFGR